MTIIRLPYEVGVMSLITSVKPDRICHLLKRDNVSDCIETLFSDDPQIVSDNTDEGSGAHILPTTVLD